MFRQQSLSNPPAVASGRSLALRPLFTRLHRYGGLAIALFLIVAGVTGSLLVFYKEIDHGLNPQLFSIQEQSGPTLPADDIVRITTSAYPEARIRAITLNREPGKSLRVLVMPQTNAETGKPFKIGFNEVYVDPFTGKVLGTRDRGAIKFDRAHIMPFIYKLHYTLQLPHKWGEWIFGLTAILWMLNAVMGFYITFPAAKKSGASRPASAHKPPKSWWSRWAISWKIKRDASAVRLNYDLHRAGGLWLCVVMFVVAMSGLSMTLGKEVFQPVVNVFSPLTQEQSRKVKVPEDVPHMSYEAALAKAHSYLPASMQGMQAISIGYVPANRAYSVFFAYPGFRKDAFNVGRERVFIDSTDGKLIQHRSYQQGTPGDKFVGMQFSLHNGQMFGLPGRLLICLTGLVTVLLTITGIRIWLKKRQAKQPRVSKSPEQPNAMRQAAQRKRAGTTV